MTTAAQVAIPAGSPSKEGAKKQAIFGVVAAPTSAASGGIVAPSAYEVICAIGRF